MFISRLRSASAELEQKLKKAGALSVHHLKCDLSSREQTEELARTLAAMDVGILFNNAGLLTGGLWKNSLWTKSTQCFKSTSTHSFISRAPLFQE